MITKIIIINNNTVFIITSRSQSAETCLCTTFKAQTSGFWNHGLKTVFGCFQLLKMTEKSICYFWNGRFLSLIGAQSSINCCTLE